MKKKKVSISPLGRHWGPVEAARILGVGTSTVQRWVDAGVIPAIRTPGGHRRIREADLRAFQQRGLTPPASQTQKSRVLLVDDDELILMYLKQTIHARAGQLEIVTASNGFDAGLLLIDLKPMIVFLDIRMPGTDGIEVCKRIRSTPELAGMRVVGITGTQNADYMARMKEAGADIVLEKPILREQVLDQVAIALKLMPDFQAVTS